MDKEQQEEYKIEATVKDLGVPIKPFFTVQEIPFLSILEENATIIRDELIENISQISKITDLFSPWIQKDLYVDSNPLGWNVFGFYNFDNKRIEENCQKFPKTVQIVEQIPGLQMAGFSALSPGCHITPHAGYAGYSDKILRSHLGLIIPENCRLKVCGEERAWEEGKMLIFDDSLTHEAWNKSDRIRIVLLIDFLTPQGIQNQGHLKLGYTEAVNKLLEK